MEFAARWNKTGTQTKAEGGPMASDNRYRGWSRRDEAKLAALVARAVPRDEIAIRLNRSRSAVGARISRLGIAEDKRRRFAAAEDEAIRGARAGGATYAEIARRLGRSEGAVKCRARWLGLAAPRHGRHDLRRPAPRKCLKHGGLFQPGHRLEFVCTPCKESEDWQAGAWMN
jgi:DNA-binding CsgD family transcriptional regulator